MSPISILGPTLQGLGASRFGSQEDLGRGIADIVGGLAEWIRSVRQGQGVPVQAASHSPAGAWGLAESRVGSVSGGEA